MRYARNLALICLMFSPMTVLADAHADALKAVHDSNMMFMHTMGDLIGKVVAIESLKEGREFLGSIPNASEEHFSEEPLTRFRVIHSCRAQSILQQDYDQKIVHGKRSCLDVPKCPKSEMPFVESIMLKRDGSADRNAVKYPDTYIRVFPGMPLASAVCFKQQGRSMDVTLETMVLAAVKGKTYEMAIVIEKRSVPLKNLGKSASDLRKDQAAAIAARTISGSISLSPDLEEKAKGFRSLVIELANSDGRRFAGNLYPLEKDLDSKHPFTFEIDLRKIPGNLEMPIPETFTVHARIGKNIESPDTLPGEIMGSLSNVKGGQTGLNLKLNSVKRAMP